MNRKRGLHIGSFIELLRQNEEWLMKKVLEYAIQNDFTKYTPTLREAWRLSVNGLSGSLIQAIEAFGDKIPEFDPDDDYVHDPASEFGLTEAQKHRSRGVTISMFMGLMKYYRQSYYDLIVYSHLSDQGKKHFQYFTERAFDRIEIAYTKEWSSHSGDEIITELQSANRNLTNEKNKYLTIFEGFYSPLIVLDGNNRIVNFNLAASKLFSDIKIDGTLYYNEVRSGEALRSVSERLNDFIRSSLHEIAYESFLDTNVGKRFFRIKLKKMIDISEKLNGTVIMFDDLTERKEMEHQLELAKIKAEEGDNLKTAFLANLSHEIRTPMNAIIGFSDLMINENMSNEERHEYLKLIQKSGNNLLKLIEDIIDIAKLDSKQFKIRPIECNIHELLEELHSIFDEFLKKENKADIDLILDIDKLSAKNLITDPDRLKQVFSNLLSNALKFTGKGYVQFGCKQIDDKNMLCYVKDTGCGIPRKKLDAVFERFFQLESSYTKEHGGTGLGLAITRNIVNLLGGDIWVESEVGQGSTFYFVIPIEFGVATKTEKKKIHFPVFQKKFPLKKYTILIAEDEEINFFYLTEILKNTGVKILWAKNGLEAVNMAETNRDIDMVLMDIKMPEINGLEAINYIRTIRPELPIVAQTAYVMDNDREICLKSGCVDFLSKPIKSAQLLEVVYSVLITREQKIKAVFTGIHEKK